MDEGDEYVPQISQIDYGAMGAGPMAAPPPQTNMSMGHQMGSLASPPQHHQMGPSGSGASGGLTPMTNPYDHPQMQMLMPPGHMGGPQQMAPPPPQAPPPAAPKKRQSKKAKAEAAAQAAAAQAMAESAVDPMASMAAMSNNPHLRPSMQQMGGGGHYPQPQMGAYPGQQQGAPQAYGQPPYGRPPHQMQQYPPQQAAGNYPMQPMYPQQARGYPPGQMPPPQQQPYGYGQPTGYPPAPQYGQMRPPYPQASSAQQPAHYWEQQQQQQQQQQPQYPGYPPTGGITPQTAQSQTGPTTSMHQSAPGSQSMSRSGTTAHHPHMPSGPGQGMPPQQGAAEQWPQQQHLQHQQTQHQIYQMEMEMRSLNQRMQQIYAQPRTPMIDQEMASLQHRMQYLQAERHRLISTMQQAQPHPASNQMPAAPPPSNQPSHSQMMSPQMQQPTPSSMSMSSQQPQANQVPIQQNPIHVTQSGSQVQVNIKPETAGRTLISVYHQYPDQNQQQDSGFPENNKDSVPPEPIPSHHNNAYPGSSAEQTRPISQQSNYSNSSGGPMPNGVETGYPQNSAQSGYPQGSYPPSNSNASSMSYPSNPYAQQAHRVPQQQQQQQPNGYSQYPPMRSQAPPQQQPPAYNQMSAQQPSTMAQNQQPMEKPFYPEQEVVDNKPIIHPVDNQTVTQPEQSVPQSEQAEELDSQPSKSQADETAETASNSHVASEDRDATPPMTAEVVEQEPISEALNEESTESNSIPVQNEEEEPSQAPEEAEIEPEKPTISETATPTSVDAQQDNQEQNEAEVNDVQDELCKEEIKEVEAEQVQERDEIPEEADFIPEKSPVKENGKLSDQADEIQEEEKEEEKEEEQEEEQEEEKEEEEEEVQENGQSEPEKEDISNDVSNQVEETEEAPEETKMDEPIFEKMEVDDEPSEPVQADEPDESMNSELKEEEHDSVLEEAEKDELREEEKDECQPSTSSENQVVEEVLTHEDREGSKVSSSEKDPTPSIADSNEGVFTEPSTPSMNDKKKYAKRPAIANKTKKKKNVVVSDDEDEDFVLETKKRKGKKSVGKKNDSPKDEDESEKRSAGKWDLPANEEGEDDELGEDSVLTVDSAEVGDALVVEKILNVKEKPEEEDQYLVKWRGRAYVHCEWKTQKELEEIDKRVIPKIKRFLQKRSQAVFENTEEDFNSDYTIVDRVIDLTEGEDGVEYGLVKWKSLGYDEVTWEPVDTIPEDKIALFKERQKIDKAKVKDKARPKANEWSKIPEDISWKDGNTLREYQFEGVNWLLYCYYNQQNCILADEMGLGKTVQTITFLHQIYEYGIHGPFLIVVPLSTIQNWVREFETWTDMNAVVYHGSAHAREILQNNEVFYDKKHCQGNKSWRKNLVKLDALITTFEMVVTDVEFLRRVNWRVCVIDEAHRLKNRNSKLIQNGLQAFKMEHRVLLTGTPLQNSIEELFSLLNFLHPQQFNSSIEFLEQFGQCKTEEQVTKLQEILKPMMLRRLKEDVEKSLIPKEETIIEVQLSDVQKKFYRAILERNFTHLCKGTSAPSLMNVMMELRKCCNHPFLINGAEETVMQEYKLLYPDLDEDALAHKALIQTSGKVVLIEKLLPKLRNDGHKVLIFSQMVRVLDILEEFLINMNYPFERIDGNVRGDVRQASIDRFSKENSDRFVFLLCTRAGGLGINLTAADTVIIFDSDWNPQNDLQAQARCHRIGQKKMVKVYRLITANTYEREMFDRASLKLGLDKAVLQSTTALRESSTALSKKDVEELLKKGAYGSIMDETSEESKFNEEDIETILQRRTTTITLEPGQKGSLFAKATFNSTHNKGDDIDIDDPEFWNKWAEKAQVDIDKLNATTDGRELILQEPRKRTKRFEDNSLKEGEDSDGSEDGLRKSKRNASNQNSNRKRRRGEDEDGDYVSYRPDELTFNKSEYFKVEKVLAQWGWGRWAEMKKSGDLEVTEMDIEHMSRTLLLHCIREFRGDERVRQTVWTLIAPEGGTAGIHRTKGPQDAYHQGWAALPEYNPPNFALDASFQRHVHRHANKLLVKIDQLWHLQVEILKDKRKDAESLETDWSTIDVNVPATPEALVDGWDADCDKCLLVGVWRHGLENYDSIKSDEKLCFATKTIPTWPSTGDISQRFRRLIQVSQRNAIIDPVYEKPKWSRHEEKEYMRVLRAFGMRDKDSDPTSIDWDAFRSFSDALANKSDEELQDYLYCVLAMCTKAQNGDLAPLDIKRAMSIDQLSYLKALKLMNRLHLTRKVHAYAMKDSEQVGLMLKLCLMDSMPEGWSTLHDKELLKICDRHGIENIAVNLLKHSKLFDGICLPPEKSLLRRVMEICTTIETGKWNGPANIETIEDSDSEGPSSSAIGISTPDASAKSTPRPLSQTPTPSMNRSANRNANSRKRPAASSSQSDAEAKMRILMQQALLSQMQTLATTSSSSSSASAQQQQQQQQQQEQIAAALMQAMLMQSLTGAATTTSSSGSSSQAQQQNQLAQAQMMAQLLALAMAMPQQTTTSNTARAATPATSSLQASTVATPSTPSISATKTTAATTTTTDAVNLIKKESTSAASTSSAQQSAANKQKEQAVAEAQAMQALANSGIGIQELMILSQLPGETKIPVMHKTTKEKVANEPLLKDLMTWLVAHPNHIVDMKGEGKTPQTPTSSAAATQALTLAKEMASASSKPKEEKESTPKREVAAKKVPSATANVRTGTSISLEDPVAIFNKKTGDLLPAAKWPKAQDLATFLDANPDYNVHSSCNVIAQVIVGSTHSSRIGGESSQASAATNGSISLGTVGTKAETQAQATASTSTPKPAEKTVSKTTASTSSASSSNQAAVDMLAKQQLEAMQLQLLMQQAMIQQSMLTMNPYALTSTPATSTAATSTASASRDDQINPMLMTALMTNPLLAQAMLLDPAAAMALAQAAAAQPTSSSNSNQSNKKFKPSGGS